MDLERRVSFFLKKLEEKRNGFNIKAWQTLERGTGRNAMSLGKKDVEPNHIELRYLFKAEGAQESLAECQWRPPLMGSNKN